MKETMQRKGRTRNEKKKTKKQTKKVKGNFFFLKAIERQEPR